MANGTLVAEVVPLADDSPEWFVLKPGASAWTRVRDSIAPSTGSAATINGIMIAWLVSAGTSTVPPVVVSANQQNL